MNPEATHYDRQCLQQLLDDALPEPLAGEISEHVADCVECRSQLESLAGHPQWWSDACSGVKAILADPTAFATNSSECSELQSPSVLSTADEAFATDFAVDFLAPSDDPAMLGRLAEYEIVEVIGRGGMGIVLKGYQRELQRYVAVKVLAPHLALSAAARRRFEREAQATAAIVNPHVMAIHAVAVHAKLPYLVMPFVACESLQQRLDEKGPLDVQDVLRIGLQAASGLAAAHAQGLVHRDVKPANILLETGVDRVMLTDFGLARAVDDATLTRTGIIAGTPQYMSPEQASGDAVDHRSDLYSLGSVLYAMCTGRPPFRAETTFGVLRRIREMPPRPLREINAAIPDWLERIVLKLLAKSPEDRFGSASEVATLLEQCLAHIQLPTSVPLPAGAEGCAGSPIPLDSQPAKLNVGFRWRAVALGGAGLATVLFAVVWQIVKPTSAPHDTTRSPTERSTLDLQLEWDATQSQLDSTAQSIDQLEARAREDLE